jgi:predicted nucleic acid-binding protein
MTYLLDACALIAFLDKEPEYAMVQELFDRAAPEQITICISIVNLVEVFYHFIKKMGEEEAVKINQPRRRAAGVWLFSRGIGRGFHTLFRPKGRGMKPAPRIMRKLDHLPLVMIESISRPVYRETARLKARYSISLGDVFLCATAKSLSATVVTKDHEIEAVERGEQLAVLWIK